jgi:hypothetical protein
MFVCIFGCTGIADALKERGSKNIWEHEIADVTKKARIYTILSEIFTLCLCF